MGANEQWLRWVGLASLVMLIGSLITVPVIIVKMQPDYFLENRNEKKSMKYRHPTMRFVGKFLKNLMGGLLILSGIIILSIPLVPGQGFLTILIGLAIMDFPGKRKLELRILKLKPVRWAIQKIRKKAEQEPLLFPFDTDPG